MFLLATPPSATAPPGSGHGSDPILVNIYQGDTTTVDSVDLRLIPGAKWIITAFIPTTKQARMFEVSAIVTQNGRVHANMFGDLGDRVNITWLAVVADSHLELSFTNNEVPLVEINVMRIQNIVMA